MNRIAGAGMAGAEIAELAARNAGRGDRNGAALWEVADLEVEKDAESWVSLLGSIKPNLRSTVYCSAIGAGGAKEWDFAWKMFENATLASEAEKLRTALSCATQPWILNRFLKYTLDANKIRKQDATATIISIASNVVGQPLAWDFVRANWAYIFNQYGGGSFSFSNLINGVTKRFSTEYELQQLKQFRDDNADIGFGSGTLAIQQSIERTTANIKWVAENKEAVLKWFQDEVKTK